MPPDPDLHTAAPCGTYHSGCPDDLDGHRCRCVDTQPHRTHACPCGHRWDEPNDADPGVPG